MSAEGEALTGGGGSASGQVQLLPAWFVKHRRMAFSMGANISVCIFAAICASRGHDNGENYMAYILALLLALITIPIEFAVDRRNPELTKDLRFDLAGAMIALAIMRLEATRSIANIYFVDQGTYGVAFDVFFFVIFLGAKLVGRSGSREVALLIMADIVDFVELTFTMSFAQNDGNNWNCPDSLANAIVAFTFIFALVTLLLQRAEGPGQKALNALVQGIFVHLPIICIRMAIPISIDNTPSFNVIFIVKNVVELGACVLDFLEAGSEVKAAGSPGGGGGYNSV